MAVTESKIILNAETGAAVKNVRELQNYIGQLRKALADEKATAEENAATAAQLAQAQNTLKDVMNSSSLTVEEARKNIDTANMSYNDLVHTMADLTKVWRATTDEAARSDIGAQINKINNQLKQLDATKGTFSRNVGNYGNQLGEAFSSVGDIVGGPFVAAVKAGSGALKVMAANPIVAVLTALVAICQKVASAFSSSEENMNALNEAMSIFKPVGDAIQRLLQGIGSVVAAVATGFAKLTTAIVGTTDAMKERQVIAKAEIELARRQRESTMANAEAERDAAKMKADAAAKDKYTTAERIELLEGAAKIENDIAKRAYEDAQLAYQIQKEKNALTDSSKEEKQAEADAYAAMIKAETDYYNKIKETAGQIAEAKTKLADEAAKAAKAVKDAATASLKAEKELIDQTAALMEQGSDERLALEKESIEKGYQMQVADAKQKITDAAQLQQTLVNLAKKRAKDIEAAERAHQKTIQSIRVQGLTNAANQYAQGSQEYLSAMVALRKQQLDDVQREVGETMESYNARLLSAQKAYYDSIRALNAKNASLATEELQLAYANGAQTTENYLAFQAQMAEANLKHIEQLGAQEGETQAAYLTRVAEARTAANAAMSDYLNYQDEQDRLHLENKMNSLTEGSVEYLAAAVTLKQQELDTLHRLEEESDEEFYARKLAAEKAYNESKKALVQEQISLTQSAATGVSSILTSLADIYESDTDASEEELRKAKNLKIAGATIDMLNGVVTAVSTAQQLGPIAGPIMAAINSASVIAAGAANIAKIKQTSTSADSGSTTDAVGVSATVSAPAVEQQVATYRNLTSQTEEDRLNQMASDQRVVLVMSDLEVAENQRKVQVSESSF